MAVQKRSSIDTLVRKVTALDKDDLLMVTYLSDNYGDGMVSLSKGLLDRSPKHNWVENSGGLPAPIEDLAVELHKKGMSISHAIATAVSKAKVYAVTSNGAKKAKWAAAVAEWERMKASAKAKSAASKLSNK